MKKVFLTIIALAAFLSGAHAQEITRLETDLSDYLPLLKDAGYEVFSWDISSLKEKTYHITFETREYAGGELVSDSGSDAFRPVFTSRDMISSFSEKNQQEIIASGDAYDLEKGIYRLGDKITIGFSPAADSLKQVRMSVNNIGSFGNKLKLRPLDAPGCEGDYAYDIRPFKTEGFKIGEFTPLILVGSFWYDKKFDIVRFCGEIEFDPDGTSETLQYVPHYYVLGVKIY